MTRSARRTRTLILVAAALLPAAALLATTSPAEAPAAGTQCAAPQWVAGWTADPSGPLGSGFTAQTLRVILTPHIGGAEIRVHISNRFGSAALVINRASVALRAAGATLVSGSGRPLTFAGQPAAGIPPGGEAVSDPAPLAVAPFEDVAVSLYMAGPTGPATGHLIARQRSYATPQASGDRTSEESGGAFTAAATTVDYVDAVDVLTPSATGAAVLLGDSITDGYVSTGPSGGEDLGGIDANHRFPDYLARRLLAEPGGPRLSVVNAGISGNQLLNDGQLADGGLSGRSRVGADVLGVTAASDAIVLEGINDIALGASAGQVTNGLSQVVAELHAHGLHVMLGTIPPAGTGLLLGTALPGLYIDSAANAVRVAVNAWIRGGSTGADGIVDFDQALRGTSQPNELDPSLDSGDHIHPSELGYSRMAETVALASLRGGQCAQHQQATTKLRLSVRSRTPGRLTLAGTLATSPASDCSGAHVTVRAVHARRTILKGSLRLTAGCRFTATRRIAATGRIEIRVSFAGSGTLLATRTRSVYVKTR